MSDKKEILLRFGLDVDEVAVSVLKRYIKKYPEYELELSHIFENMTSEIFREILTSISMGKNNGI